LNDEKIYDWKNILLFERHKMQKQVTIALFLSMCYNSLLMICKVFINELLTINK